MPGYLFIFFSIVALGFLIYSLTHLKKLKINITHPRIIVELLLFIIFMAAGVLLILKH